MAHLLNSSVVAAASPALRRRPFLRPTLHPSGCRTRRPLQVQANIREIFMPALSSTMTEGKIVSWIKTEGDKLAKGESVVVVESDKADMDVETFYGVGLITPVLQDADKEIVNHFGVPVLRNFRKGCRLNVGRFPKLEADVSKELTMESQSSTMFTNCRPEKGLGVFVSAFSSGQFLWLISAEAAFAREEIRTNAVYEIGELFELGIQLSYLLLLLGLLGVGTFFVVRQVLVRRELDLSAKELQEQVRSGDASAMEYFELGAVMLRRKFYPAATKYLLQAIDKWDGDDQDLAQVYNALGVSYVRDDKLDKGITQLETAVKLQPGYVTAWNNLGDAYEKKKEYKLALKAFEEVLLFDPNNRLARPRRDALKERVEMYKGVPVKSKNR